MTKELVSDCPKQEDNKMKYFLFVSYDCGINYEKEAESDNPKELLEKARELDERGLRWFVEDEKGNFVDISSIQKQIIVTVAELNKQSGVNNKGKEKE